jgi:ribosomal protein S27AE
MNFAFNMSEKKPLEFLMISPDGTLMEEGPIFKGDDIFAKDITCPGCGFLIAQKIKYETIDSILKFCPKCGTQYQQLE